MSDGVVYIMTLVLLIALGGLAIWIVQQSTGGSGLKLFKNKLKRTGVIEASSVDSRRRLVLIRRDNVEHLIMTGGPVDVVIETGIPSRVDLTNGLGDALARADAGLDGARPAYSADEGPLGLSPDIKA